MTDHAHTARVEPAGDDRTDALRELGARAHQLRATTRAADHYLAQDAAGAANTASWLMSASLDNATELVADIDALARSLREAPAGTVDGAVSRLRVLAHQLQAAVKAADDFLDHDGGDFRDTGTWLVAAAAGLAARLAGGLDDAVAAARKPSDRARLDKATIEAHDAPFARRLAAATGSPQAA
jgi:hypothetical protein